MAAPLVFAAAAALIVSSRAPQALAQAKVPDPVEETLRTADGIQLHGWFHASAKTPGSDPVVVLLYPPGKDRDMTKGDWKGLATRLQEEGYNVFRFDWRGHGKSVDIKDTDRFWANPYTGPWNLKYIKGAPPVNGGAVAPGVKVKNHFEFKDLSDAGSGRTTAYLPVFLNDLAAVRAHIDSKNDANALNTSSVYLIGAGDAAALGFGWLTTEWQRPKFYPTPNQLGVLPKYEFVPQKLNGGIDEAGEDVSACVWLSPTHPAVTPPQLLKDWISKAAPKLRENNPMLFLTADKDTNGRREVDFFYKEVLVAEPPKMSPLQPLSGTFRKEIQKANALTGAGLLGNNAMLGTEDEIVKFLNKRQKDRATLIAKPRGYTSPYFVSLFDFGFKP